MEHTFSIEAIHHGLNYVQLILNGEVYKVGVDQDVVWGTKLAVVAEEES